MERHLRHINISDLHISIYKDPSNYMTELMDIINHIDRVRDDLDVVTIAGDLFDRVYPANHKAINVAVEFIKMLLIRARAYKFMIFLVKGTESHDSSQLDIFKGLEEENLFYIIRDVEFYEIKGMLFRFIPEYYSNEYQELYDKAFTTKADITVYHGSIESAMPFAKSEKADIVKNAQVVPDEDMVMTTGLYTVCGHIHNRRNIKKNIWYTGSYSSKSFSDANTRKGFDDIIVDTIDYTYQVNFIENKKCRKYEIIDGTNICKQSISKMKAFFNNLKFEKKDKDIIRIDVNTNSYTDEEYKNLSFIMSSYKGIFTFNIERQVTQIKNTGSILEDAEYVLSPTVSLTEKIQKTISEIYEVDMESDRIKELLDIPLNVEILADEIPEKSKTEG